MTVPFAANYRLVTARPVLVDGILRSNGDVIPVPAQGAAMARAPGDHGDALTVLLLLASARPPPAGELAPGPLFRGL